MDGILQAISHFVSENLTWLGVIQLILWLIVVIFRKTAIIVFTLINASEFFIYTYLFKSDKIDYIFYVALSFHVFYSTYYFLSSIKGRDSDHFHFIGNFTVAKTNISAIIDVLLGLYAVISLPFFESAYFMKFSLIIALTYVLWFLIRKVNIQNTHIKLKSNNNLLGNFNFLLKDNSLSSLKRDFGTNIIPFPFTSFCNNFWFFLVSIFVITLRLQLSELNFGVFDFRNLKSSGTQNVKNTHRLMFMSIVMTYFFVSGITLKSLFIFYLMCFFWSFVRRSFNKPFTYFTNISGFDGRVVDQDFINHIFTKITKSTFNIYELIKLKQKNFTYGIIFSKPELTYFNSYKNFFFVEDFHNPSDTLSHFILMFNKEPILTNFTCEKNLISALKSPISIIDAFENERNFNEYKIQKIEEFQNQIIFNRVSIISHICDEPLNPILSELESDAKENSILNTYRIQTEILNLSSFESLRQNIRIYENGFNSDDKTQLQNLYSNGIFEFNTLFRQLHESPSIPSRFIDLLNVAECISRYLVGFCFAERIEDSYDLGSHLAFDTKAISFGTCTDYLSRWKNQYKSQEISILGNSINSFLNVRYEDEENILELIKFLKQLNPNKQVKYSRKPDMIELLKWIVFVRNKTRGHGTPSKVDYQFYVCLEKTILFILSSATEMKIKPCFRANFNELNWTIDLSKGGLPVIVPIVENLEDGIHFNPYLEKNEIEEMKQRHFEIINNIKEEQSCLYLSITDGTITEWWTCKNHFKVDDGIVYVLNSRSPENESWISFSTGNIIRPTLIEE